MSLPNGSRRREKRLVHSPRAVIDIGSNTVRLVIYEGSRRAPVPIWNEKVAARLGRDLSETGRIPDEAMDEALGALSRYALLLSDLGVEEVQTVATAAARDATNGAAFLERVRALGLNPRLLSGEAEARASAMGAIGAFPGRDGMVLDLGGGSLEAVAIDGGACRQAVSLPLGTLRLPALRAEGKSAFAKTIERAMKDAPRAPGDDPTLFMIGGTWRAFAAFAMRAQDYPLTDPHGFTLPAKDALTLARRARETSPEDLQNISGISTMRSHYLPDAAAMLRVLLKRLEPSRLIFSSWGLREGLLMEQLGEAQLGQDPLLDGVAEFAEMLRAPTLHRTLLAAWSAVTVSANGENEDERLRLAAAHLAAALYRVEPNLRATQAVQWALDKRWIDLDARGRAMIGAALLGSLGKSEPHDRFTVLAKESDLGVATGWGLGFRLARRVGAAGQVSLSNSRLDRDEKQLTLVLAPSHAALGHYPISKDLAQLAGHLGLEPVVRQAN